MATPLKARTKEEHAPGNPVFGCKGHAEIFRRKQYEGVSMWLRQVYEWKIYFQSVLSSLMDTPRCGRSQISTMPHSMPDVERLERKTTVFLSMKWLKNWTLVTARCIGWLAMFCSTIKCLSDEYQYNLQHTLRSAMWTCARRWSGARKLREILFERITTGDDLESTTQSQKRIAQANSTLCQGDQKGSGHFPLEARLC